MSRVNALTLCCHWCLQSSLVVAVTPNSHAAPIPGTDDSVTTAST